MRDSCWGLRLTADQAASQLRQTWRCHPELREHNVLFGHDLALLDRRLQELQSVFPSGTLHSVAIKANPLVEVLKACVEAGAGLEAASLGEVDLALAAGCPPERLVFDSPVKTERELREVLQLGCVVNADNAQEVERIDLLPHHPKARLGLRVNPVVGAGTIAATSVAGPDSKFGMPIHPDSGLVEELFARYDWLRGLHVHVGSQGCGLDLLTQGVERTYQLAHRVGARSYLDIGGGLPARYRDRDAALTPEVYWERLKPILGRDHPPLVTEFGRALQANCGWAVTRVEAVKSGHLALVHAGADAFLRTVYMPEAWPLEMVALDKQGVLKSGPPQEWDIGGPLCFNADYLGRRVSLPALQPGDWLLVRDTGAYTLSLWSHYCSRPFPPVVGLRGGEVSLLRAPDSRAQVVAFWSRDRKAR